MNKYTKLGLKKEAQIKMGYTHKQRKRPTPPWWATMFALVKSKNFKP